MLARNEGVQLLTSIQYGFVFIHVPKTAGISIETALRPFSDVRKSFRAERHVSAQEARDEIVGVDRWEERFSFAVARNPWEREHSEWSFLRSVEYRPELPDFARSVELAKRLDFSQWVRLSATGSDPLQSRVCDDNGKEIVSKVYLFESLASSWSEIVERCRVPNAILPKLNETSGRGDYREEFDQESADLIRLRDWKTIERFGYEF